MELETRIIKGVHSDNDPHYQPEDTARRSLNGSIISTGEGSYVWEPMYGNKICFMADVGYDIAAWCEMKGDLYVLGWENHPAPIVLELWKITINHETCTGTKSSLGTWWDAKVNMSTDHPIRKMIGVWESVNLQRIYFTDWNNQLRVITIKNGSAITTINFLNVTPDLDGVLGKGTFLPGTDNGSLACGNYYFTWRYYSQDGYFTNWSYLTSNIPVTADSPGPDFKDHQFLDGGSPRENAQKAIKIQLTGLDTNYSYIQAAYFYSDDFNSFGPGVIFYDGELTASSMDITLYGNENLATLLIEDLFSSDITIEKVRDITSIRNRLVIANIKERAELDIPNKMTGISCTEEYAEIVLDAAEDVLRSIGSTGMVDDATAPSIGQVLAGQYTAENDLYGTTKQWHVKAGIWYRADGNGKWIEDESAAENVFSKNDRFLPAEPGYIFSAAISSVADDGGNAKIATAVAHLLSVGDSVRIWDSTEYTGTWTILDVDDSTHFTIDAVYTSTDTGWCCAKLTAIIRIKKYENGQSPGTYYYREHELGNHYFDYKNPVICNHMVGYPGGETIRLGVLFFDLQGRPYFTRWLCDYTTPERAVTGADDSNSITKIYHDKDDGQGILAMQCNGQVMSLVVSGIDITDIKDQISGFCIVRAPIQRSNIAHGIIENTQADGNDTKLYGAHISFWDAGRRKNTYTLILPEILLGDNMASIQPGDFIRNLGYYKQYEPGREDEAEYDGFGAVETDVDGTNTKFSLYSKFYRPFKKTVINKNGQQFLQNAIKSIDILDVAEDDYQYDPENTTIRWRKAVTNESAEAGVASKVILVTTENDETGTLSKGQVNDVSRDRADTTVHYVAIRRPVSNPYGGSSDSLLANTFYMTVGHFQEVDATVLSQIFDGVSKYVFNDVQIFGGDCFIGLMDYARVLPDENEAARFGQSTVFGVESRINLAMRDGRRILRNMSYKVGLTTDGIRYHPTGSILQLEEFSYNDGYSSTEIAPIFPSLPYPFSLSSEFDARFRWSLSKTMGEQQDSYRRYLAANRLDLGAENGQIVNVRSKFNRLIYWQEDAIGFVPIEERQLDVTEFGEPVEIGIGGTFERYDDKDTMVGNQHQFGLVESEFGFHWMDMRRGVVYSLDKSLSMSMDSIVKGMNNFLKDRILPQLMTNDNPFADKGIVGGYDPERKQVFLCFKQYVTTPEDSDFTVGIDAKLNAFIGEFSFNPRSMITWQRYLLQIGSGTLERQAYIHGKGNLLEFFSQTYDAYVEFVLKDPAMIQSIFDNFVVTGNSNFFSRIECNNGIDTVSENLVDASNNQLTRDLAYRNGKWFGNFPLINRKRLAESAYLKVKFSIEDARDDFVRLIHMRSTYRQTY